MKRKKGQRLKNAPHITGLDLAIGAGVKTSEMARRFDAQPEAVARYRKNEYPKVVASAVVDDRAKLALDTIIARMDGGISKIEKITEACQKYLMDANGDYDLSNPKKAGPYVKMLIEAVKVLSPSLKDMANIMGAVKERAEIENNPVLILAQIGQVIQGAGSREEIIAGLKRLKQDNGGRD